MTDNATYSRLAVMYELNGMEFKRKLTLFPEELRFYVMLAGSIIGYENSKRVEAAPQAVVQEGKDFIDGLFKMVNPDKDGLFREIIETCLIETLCDELKFSCINCLRFDKCIDMENLTAGELFRKRAAGQETDELKHEISLQIKNALNRTPYAFSDEAHKSCPDFVHQYSISNIGELIGRYALIAASLQNDFGIDYKKIQQQLVAVNMEFCKKIKELV